MPEQLTEFDAAEYIESAETFLDACIVEDPGDGSVIRAGLSAVARAQGMSNLAQDTGLDRAGIYRALSERGNPSLTTVLKILSALGLRMRIEASEQSPRRSS